MTIQSLILLRALKKVQISENRNVFVDHDALEIRTVSSPDKPCKTLSIKKYSDSYEAVLQYLKKNGLIEVTGPFQNIVTVIHGGWKYWQTFFSHAGQFLVKSVVVPIVVSAITTLVTLWITG